jgi:hypothetical protein
MLAVQPQYGRLAESRADRGRSRLTEGDMVKVAVAVFAIASRGDLRKPSIPQSIGRRENDGKRWVAVSWRTRYCWPTVLTIVEISNG